MSVQLTALWRQAPPLEFTDNIIIFRHEASSQPKQIVRLDATCEQTRNCHIYYAMPPNHQQAFRLFVCISEVGARRCASQPPSPTQEWRMSHPCEIVSYSRAARFYFFSIQVQSDLFCRCRIWFSLNTNYWWCRCFIWLASCWSNFPTLPQKN